MIHVENLTKTYGSTVAIRKLSFTVERGEIVGFLGPNGAGKTTTMRILSGALGATEGIAKVGGIDVFEDPLSVKRIVGYLPEVPPLYPEMTVRGFLRFAARIKRAADPDTSVEEQIVKVGLAQVAHRAIGHLSKGYRQRVGIAQALVHRPQVLILDEPASGLDPAQRVEIRTLVSELARGDVTVILSTHVLPEVEAICDRVIIVNQGHIVAQDTLEALAAVGAQVTVAVARPDADFVARISAIEGVMAVREQGPGQYVVSASKDVREDVAHAAVGCGLLELHGRRALEDVYLAATGTG